MKKENSCIDDKHYYEVKYMFLLPNGKTVKIGNLENVPGEKMAFKFVEENFDFLSSLGLVVLRNPVADKERFNKRYTYIGEILSKKESIHLYADRLQKTLLVGFKPWGLAEDEGGWFVENHIDRLSIGCINALIQYIQSGGKVWDGSFITEEKDWNINEVDEIVLRKPLRINGVKVASKGDKVMIDEGDDMFSFREAEVYVNDIYSYIEAIGVPKSIDMEYEIRRLSIDNLTNKITIGCETFNSLPVLAALNKAAEVLTA